MKVASLLLFIVASLMLLASTARSAEPGDAAKAALRGRNYPWYDAPKDGYKSLKPPKDDIPPLSQDREFGNVRFPAIQILMWTVLGIIIALLVMAIIHWLKNMTPPVAETKTTIEASVSMERLEALPEAARGVRDLLGEATRLAALGDYGKAITFYYSWQLMQLDKFGLLELQKGKTNRQYLLEVKQSNPDLTSLLRRSTRLFEDAFFGSLAVAREDFEEVWSQRRTFDEPARRRPS
jgi:hypothetical protein